MKIDEQFEPDSLFRQARKIASLAAALDYDKNTFPEETRILAANCVDELHNLAEKLAGDKVNDIYL